MEADLEDERLSVVAQLAGVPLRLLRLRLLPLHLPPYMPRVTNKRLPTTDRRAALRKAMPLQIEIVILASTLKRLVVH